MRGSSTPISMMPSLTSTPYHSTGIFRRSYHLLISLQAPTTRFELSTFPNCGRKSSWQKLTGSSLHPLMTNPRITGLATSLNVREIPSRVSTVSGVTSLKMPVLKTRTTSCLISLTVYEKLGLI